MSKTKKQIALDKLVNRKQVDTKYHCNECNDNFDTTISTNDDTIERCPNCGSDKIKEY